MRFVEGPFFLSYFFPFWGECSRPTDPLGDGCTASTAAVGRFPEVSLRDCRS